MCEADTSAWLTAFCREPGCVHLTVRACRNRRLVIVVCKWEPREIASARGGNVDVSSLNHRARSFRPCGPDFWQGRGQM